MIGPVTTRRMLAVVALCAVSGLAATPPDAATRRWWSHIRVLAADGMEGRDAGSAGHRRAAEYAAARFAAAGLTPAGEGGFFQPVPLHAVRLVPEQSSVELVRPSGQAVAWRWLRNIVLLPRTGDPETFDQPLGFSGWETPPDMVPDRILAALAPPRFVPGPRGYATPPPRGYYGTVTIDSPAGPEPMRWPSFLGHRPVRRCAAAVASAGNHVELPAQFRRRRSAVRGFGAQLRRAALDGRRWPTAAVLPDAHAPARPPGDRHA